MQRATDLTPATFDYGWHSERGARPRNEDTALSFAWGPAVVGIVADGMGGGLDGKRFSTEAAEGMQVELLRASEPGSAELFWAALQSTIDAIRALRATDPRYHASGTTLLAALIRPEGQRLDVQIVNIGDSRAYRVSPGGQTEILTTDHTYGARLKAQGMSEAEAESDPQSKRLTYVLGATFRLDQVPDVRRDVSLESGAYLILCTDGISRSLSDRQIAETVRGKGALAAARALARAALKVGSHDNVTALVVRNAPAAHSRGPTVGAARWSWLIPTLLGVALIAVLGAGLAFAGAALAPAGPPTVISLPSITPLPIVETATPTVTSIPTTGSPMSTLAPPSHTPTATSTPTRTATPTNTATPTRTRMPIFPTATLTAISGSADTPALPTDTPALPTDTPVPLADTSASPTDTPTNTPADATNGDITSGNQPGQAP